jgi:hypothetical protein
MAGQMSNRMNYGKRFRQGAVTVGYHYDEILHRGMMSPQFFKMTDQQRKFAAAKSHGTRVKKKVGMPEFSFNKKKLSPGQQREAAEQHLIDCVHAAVEALDSAMVALLKVPKPVAHFPHRINQQTVLDLLVRLAKCARPPLTLRSHHVAEQQPALVRMELEELCVECGGPARIQHQGAWYCEHCNPLREVSDQRRERAREIREQEREANRLKVAINEVEKVMKDVQGHGRHTR